jgi:hypothetical protein
LSLAKELTFFQQIALKSGLLAKLKKEKLRNPARNLCKDISRKGK